MTNSHKARTLLVLAATAVYWLVIFVGTHFPGSVVHASGHQDKFLHFGAFLGLALLLCLCLARFGSLRLWHYAGVIGAIAGYGIIDELTQTLATNRTADPLDWLADMSGSILGTVVFAVGMNLTQRHRGTKREAE